MFFFVIQYTPLSVTFVKKRKDIVSPMEIERIFWAKYYCSHVIYFCWSMTIKLQKLKGPCVNSERKHPSPWCRNVIRSSYKRERIDAVSLAALGQRKSCFLPVLFLCLALSVGGLKAQHVLSNIPHETSMLMRDRGTVGD